MSGFRSGQPKAVILLSAKSRQCSEADETKRRPFWDGRRLRKATWPERGDVNAGRLTSDEVRDDSARHG